MEKYCCEYSAEWMAASVNSSFFILFHLLAPRQRQQQQRTKFSWNNANSSNKHTYQWASNWLDSPISLQQLFVFNFQYVPLFQRSHALHECEFMCICVNVNVSVYCSLFYTFFSAYFFGFTCGFIQNFILECINARWVIQFIHFFCNQNIFFSVNPAHVFGRIGIKRANDTWKCSQFSNFVHSFRSTFVLFFPPLKKSSFFRSLFLQPRTELTKKRQKRDSQKIQLNYGTRNKNNWNYL